MRIIERSGIFVLAALVCLLCGGSRAEADWAACEAKPTRACLLDEAMRGDAGQPLTGKDRLNVLIQGGALTHPDVITAADIAEAQGIAKSAPNVTSLYFAYVAIHGLIAANQKQQAIDLIGALASPAPSLSLNAVQTLSINELVAELVKAGDVETALAVPDKIQPPLDPKALPGVRHTVVIATIKALADAGKIDQALKLLDNQQYLTETQTADLQAAVGQSLVKRGDGKLAEKFFDQAEKNLQAATQSAGGSSLQARFASIRLLALRGKVDDVKAALQQMAASNDAAGSDPRASYERTQGYLRVVSALADAKQPEAALAVAKSVTPDTTKEAALVGIAVGYASNGRLADARNVLALINSPSETPARVTIIRNLAMASARQGDVTAALKTAAEIHAPLNRRPILLAIALALPQ